MINVTINSHNSTVLSSYDPILFIFLISFNSNLTFFGVMFIFTCQNVCQILFYYLDLDTWPILKSMSLAMNEVSEQADYTSLLLS